MSAAVVYLLFAISSNSAPDLSALAVYSTREACAAALAQVADALSTGEDGTHLLCIGSDSLTALGEANGISHN